MSNQPGTQKEHIAKLGEMIQDIDMAMMTTEDESGQLRSRPMSTQKTEFDGTLWFFTRESSAKVDEIQKERQVNLSYADPKHQRYVSVSGTAVLVQDHAKMAELWNPIYKAYFGSGLEDPDLALLKVTVTQAEYWDAPSSKVVQIAGFIKAAVTGKEYNAGDHDKIELI